MSADAVLAPASSRTTRRGARPLAAAARSSATSSGRSGSRSSSRSRSRRRAPAARRSTTSCSPGRPGLGKTSLAYIVREELGVGIRTVAGPALERKGDMAAILTSLEERDVLFIDEIHRLSRAVEEILYPALEDFRLDIVVGQGPAARTLTLDLPPFTLVGATTRTGLLTTPLRDRFGMTFRLDYYDAGGARAHRPPLGRHPRRPDRSRRSRREIARRSRGTPRVANRILRRVRDVAEVRHEGAVTTEIAHEALQLLEVDEHGLERSDRALLARSSSKFGGGPVGLSTLAVALGEEPDTIEDVYEPYLLQLGFIQRTPRGRIVTELGRRHVGAPATRTTGASSMPGSCGSRGRLRPSIEDFVGRVHRQIERFAKETPGGEAQVEVELRDGSCCRSSRSSPSRASASSRSEPHSRRKEEVVVPIGAIAQIRIGKAEPRVRPGFALPVRARAAALELQLVPGRHGRELEQGAPAAARVAVGEVRLVVVPGDLEQAFLDAVVEPGAAEDELAQPVDERLALHERELLPVANEVAAERAPGLPDPPAGGQLDQVGRLVVVELVCLQRGRA